MFCESLPVAAALPLVLRCRLCCAAAGAGAAVLLCLASLFPSLTPPGTGIFFQHTGHLCLLSRTPPRFVKACSI